jgi:hypothetical protein
VLYPFVACKLDVSSSAYLEEYTQKKVCFIAGPEIGPLEGHLIVIVRPLYGLRTSVARWHDRYADVMHIPRCVDD